MGQIHLLRLTNGASFAFVLVPEDKAREGLKKAGASRKGLLEIEVVPIAVATTATGYSTKTRTVDLEVVRMRVSAGRYVIAEVGTPKAKPQQAAAAEGE